MSDRSTPSQDTPSPAPDTGRGGTIRRGPFPMFLMDIAQSEDADRRLRELDMLKDDALEAADTAIRATGTALADLCDALCWTAANGDIQAITAVTGVWTPRGLLLTATVTVAACPSDTKVIEHVLLSLVQGGPLLEYVSKDPEALAAALVTRWSPSHVSISASRLRSQVFKGLYTAREQPPPIDTTAPPDIQSQKVSHKIHKPINRFLAPHLRPSWDRLRTRVVVAAFWALPNDVHAVLQAGHIPTADLVPLKFGLLAWASSVCLTGQYTPAPVPTPLALANTGIWTPEQLRPLLECSVLPIRSVELLHQIEQAGEHSWARAPTFALLQAGIADTASPPPLTPPSHAPYLTKGQAAPSPAGTLFATAAFTPASALYQSQDKPTPSGSEPSPSSLLPEQTRLSFNLLEPASQVPPAAADPTPPESPTPAVGSAPPSPSQVGEPFVPDLDVTTPPTTLNCVTSTRHSGGSWPWHGATWSPSHGIWTWFAQNEIMPSSRPSVTPRHSGRPRPFGSTASSGRFPPSCPSPPDSKTSSPRRRRSPTPCAVPFRLHSSCLPPALSSSWSSCRSYSPQQFSPRPRHPTSRS